MNLGLMKFQFTHPGRGATEEDDSWSMEDSVSIHAPREGCDRQARLSLLRRRRFNSRTPGGVRLQRAYPLHRPLLVSIHAPREGCDVLRHIGLNSQELFQFTHTGRGATQPFGFASSPLACFNSRTPGGVRRSYLPEAFICI